jgi:putative ABC transport system ATP-binding protein
MEKGFGGHVMKKNNDLVIRLENVCKKYVMGAVEVKALCGVNIGIQKGEFVAIQGPSGSGKSTAMNMVGCLDVPTEGRIFLEHHDISHLAESDLAQIRGRKIGFIFQQFNLIPTLTALENVMLPMIFQDTTREDRVLKATELLNLVDLGDRLNHKPSEMSGGQQQRVAIARALSNDPEVILADEPTGNLDSKTGTNVMEFLQKLHREKGKTIIMVTHDSNLAKYADRIIYLKDGAVVKALKN